MDKSQYREEPYRFVVILTYLAAALVNSIPVHTFSSINVAVERIFRISSTQVTMNALLFTIAHPLFAFPCNWLINKKGMRVSFIVGAVFTIGGVWLRLLIEEENSIFCLIGSGLAAIGSIFVLNTPSKVAINWFRSDMVNLASFTGILFNLLSVTLGASLPGYLINDTTSTSQDVKQLLFIEACVISVPYIFLVIFFKDNPTQPPSKSAAAIANQKPQKYNDLLKQLFKNKQYLKLMASMSLNYGTLTATIAVLDQGIKGLNYTNSSEITSSTILSAMLIGVLGNPVFSILLRKTKAYRAVSGLATFGGFFMFTLLMIAYVYQVTNTLYILILGGLLGLYLIPLPSIMIMYGSQLVFPLDESSSAGYLLAASQTFGFIIGFTAITLLDKTAERSKLVFFSFSGLLFLSFLIIITVKENLNKMRFSMDATNHEKTDTTDSLIVKETQQP